MSTDIIKLKATADILGGAVFFATDAGIDPEHPNNGDLLPNGMYIRLEGSDGSIAYISAYELDKALGIIGEMSMSKASSSDVATIQAALEDKASVIEFELLQGEVAGKASKADVDEIKDIFATKADQSVVDEIITQLNEKATQEYAESLMAEIEAKANASDLTDLIAQVESKANIEAVQQMQADVAALQETVQLLTNSDSIAAINNQIAYLNNEIQRRLTIDDLSSINTKLSELENDNTVFSERMDNVETNLSKKATTTYVQGQVTELNTAITGLAVKVDEKANTSDVINKANKADLDAVVARVNTIGTTLSDLEVEVNTNYDELTTAISDKAIKSEVDTTIAGIVTDLANKSDKTLVDAELSSLNAAVQTLSSAYDDDITRIENNVNAIECELNNKITSINSIVSSQATIVSNQAENIKTLQDNAKTNANKLKQSWVRVLSSNEYKKLWKNPDLNETYNPKYLYPNTVYLVVDFNKPKAIYIGDIMIAQSEQKGSIGFAYTFPIVF